MRSKRIKFGEIIMHGGLRSVTIPRSLRWVEEQGGHHPEFEVNLRKSFEASLSCNVRSCLHTANACPRNVGYICVLVILGCFLHSC